MSALIPILAVNGLIWGLIIALIALGLSIIFGLLDVTNVAHGDMFMVGAVLAWFLIDWSGSFLLALVLVPILGAVIGVAVQKLAIEPVQASPAAAVVATFGVSIVLQEAVRATFGAVPQRIAPPVSGTVALFGIQYELYRIVAALIAATVLASFFLFLRATKYGTWMRAVRQNRDMAIALGIPARQVFTVTFAIGSAMAMLGGVVAAPITSVDFRLGLDVLPICFMAVVIGGLTNLPGTAAAAVLIAVFEGVVTALSDPTSARILSLVLMSVALVVRPRGLFSRAA